MTREPMYDEESLVALRQQETEALIAALAQYCKSLEQQVVELRHDVNRLTSPGQEKPFPDVHSDLYETFDHLAAYPRFRHLLTELE
ncbi:hypothetical protein VE23_01735 [Paenibacillus sp. D9]|uniref:hypothetical protein n=1 Tax=Paenibacillus sp. D9 TaxID=665792 RepID=UPI00061F121E|nr:hypothetical protein [Paenibacillus sp. D9]KKC45815.1 hypothetical protein VE23_25160 [Paenibacillus sp. D9]KKC46116.1 hypothetical protein VE23_01735 [Paenibacillus sp. D9]